MGIHYQGWLSGGPEKTYQNQALELWYQFLLAIPYQYVANQERSTRCWIVESMWNIYIKTIYCQIAYSFEIHWRNPHLHKCFFTNCSLGSHLAKGQLSLDDWGNCTEPRMKIKSNIVSKIWLYKTRKVIGLLHNWSKSINSSLGHVGAVNFETNLSEHKQGWHIMRNDGSWGHEVLNRCPRKLGRCTFTIFHPSFPQL